MEWSEGIRGRLAPPVRPGGGGGSIGLTQTQSDLFSCGPH
jgi:hypothetical protein